jgi:hypothetical protein
VARIAPLGSGATSPFMRIRRARLAPVAGSDKGVSFLSTRGQEIPPDVGPGWVALHGNIMAARSEDIAKSVTVPPSNAASSRDSTVGDMFTAAVPR